MGNGETNCLLHVDRVDGPRHRRWQDVIEARVVNVGGRREAGLAALEHVSSDCLLERRRHRRSRRMRQGARLPDAVSRALSARRAAP